MKRGKKVEKKMGKKNFDPKIGDPDSPLPQKNEKVKKKRKNMKMKKEKKS